MKTCCLCQNPIHGHGNNPAPLGQLPDLCCDWCNSMRVIPERLGVSRVNFGEPHQKSAH